MVNDNAQNKIRVLLADDHAVVRAGIRQFLEHAGDIEIIAEADDGQMAKELILQEHPHVAVLDIQMPLATGIEVTRWARTNQQQVGILILTAYDDDPYILAVLQAGANGYVLKTASPFEIIQAVREVHAGHSAVNGFIAQKLFSQLSHPPRPSQVEPLTDRETQVLVLTSKGYTNKAIATQLGISDRTVQGHLAHIFDKLNASSRTEAVMRGISLGLIASDAIQSSYLG